MPALENPRQEKFCKNVVKGMTKDKAYQVAGYKPNRHNAARLANTNEHIQQRIAELQQIEFGKFATEKEFIRQMFLNNYTKAMESNNLAAANVAADKLARLDGHMIERKEIGGPGDFASLSDEQLIELIAEPLTGAYELADGEGDEG